MIRSCIINFEGNNDKHLPLVEFANNNSLHSFVSIAPSKAMYVRRCRSPIRWFEVGVPLLIGIDLIFKTLESSYYKKPNANIL